MQKTGERESNFQNTSKDKLPPLWQHEVPFVAGSSLLSEMDSLDESSKVVHQGGVVLQRPTLTPPKDLIFRC